MLKRQVKNIKHVRLDMQIFLLGNREHQMFRVEGIEYNVKEHQKYI